MLGFQGIWIKQIDEVIDPAKTRDRISNALNSYSPKEIHSKKTIDSW